jgi:hypothetical protein
LNYGTGKWEENGRKMKIYFLQRETKEGKYIEKVRSFWNKRINKYNLPPMTVATMLKVAANKLLFLRVDSYGGRSNSNEGMLLRAKKCSSSSSSSSMPVLLKDDPDKFSGSWTAKEYFSVFPWNAETVFDIV